jgi:hypothetical protein
MNRLKFLVVAFAITVSALGFYSCATDGTTHSDFANQNVELRSRCGDNFNVAPTPTYSVNLENGLCCYSFTFTGIASGLGYEIYGLNNNGTYIGGPLVPNTYCS